MKKITAVIAIIIFLTSTFSTHLLYAQEKGKLGDFKEEVDNPSGSSSSTSSFDAQTVAAQSILDILLSFFLMGLMQTGGQTTPELFHELKNEWSPALPTVKFEPSYQYAMGNINGFSGKIEMGYLVLGVDGEYLYYIEKKGIDNLNLWSSHLLLRTMFMQHFGVNLALGAKAIRGGLRHTGFDMGIPFYIFLSNHFIFDILPYATFFKSSKMYDIDGGLSYKYKYFGVRAGYRGLFVGGQKIHGPRVSLFFQY